MGEYKSKFEWIKDYEFTRNHLLGLFFIFLLGIVFRENLFPVFVLLGLYLIDIVFSFILRFTLMPFYRVLPLGLEMVTFNTVVAALAFGPTVGILCGLWFSLTYYGVAFNFNSIYQLVTLPTYMLVGYLAATLPISDFVTLGVVISVIYSVITCSLSFLFLGARFSKCMIFIVSNIMFNHWLFSKASPIVLSIIK